jgi:hypothetical protein
METKEIIMYVVLSAACIVPVVLFVRAASSKTRLVTGSLKKTIKKLPSQYDVWLTRGMAFDPATESVVYVNHDPDDEKNTQLWLSEIAECQVMVNGKKVAADQKNIDMNATKSIELMIITRGANRGENLLRFFTVDIDGPFQANFHYQLARKWRKTIAAHANLK